MMWIVTLAFALAFSFAFAGWFRASRHLYEIKREFRGRIVETPWLTERRLFLENRVLVLDGQILAKDAELKRKNQELERLLGNNA